MAEFKLGDIVRFKAGKRKMQIFVVYKNETYECEWETEDGYDTRTFFGYQLEKLKKN